MTILTPICLCALITPIDVHLSFTAPDWGDSPSMDLIVHARALGLAAST